MKHPYEELPNKAFWSPAVGQRNSFEISELWFPKFRINPNTKFATFGSCFAQHFGAALRRNGYNWLDTEPAPFGLKESSVKRFNYGVFTARTGNIYTTSLLLQWTQWALDEKSTPDEVWEKEGRFYDPFRPTIEPNGFSNREEVIESRNQAIRSFRTAIESAQVFVFTLGLTESWFDVGGWEYPMCPGTVAGQFSEEQHKFRNQSYPEVRNALMSAINLMKNRNHKIRFLLTVSPVPLTATNSGDHVLVATMHSKSVLRAVAGHCSTQRKNVDYFPSYELINSPAFGGAFFEANKRNVSAYGVAFVMNTFFSAIGLDATAANKSNRKPAVGKQAASDAKCDEELLEAFSNG